MVEPVKIPGLWARVVAFDIGGNQAAAVWGAINRTTDTIYLYDCITGPRQPIPIHADAMRAKGRWIPVLFDKRAHGRTEEEGMQIAQRLASLNLEVMVASADLETGVAELSTRLSTGRLKVVDELEPWFDAYRRYTRDEEGKLVEDDDHLMRATGLLMVHGNEVAVTENQARSDEEGFDQSAWERGRSVTGY